MIVVDYNQTAIGSFMAGSKNKLVTSKLFKENKSVPPGRSKFSYK